LKRDAYGKLFTVHILDIPLDKLDHIKVLQKHVFKCRLPFNWLIGNMTPDINPKGKYRYLFFYREKRQL
jgi:hypothetical protein